MKKRIAVIICGNLSSNRQGMLNSAIYRVKYLKELEAFDIDVYCIHGYDWGLLRRLHKSKRIPKRQSYEIEGIPIKVIYKKSLLIDLVFESLLKITPIYSAYCSRKIARQFKNYDLVVGHSTKGGDIALNVYKYYKTPYSVTWHGSDIHTNPVSNRYKRRLTEKILNCSSANIFVSRSLLSDAIQLFGSIPNPHICYNAPGETFVRYSNEKRIELRKKENVLKKKVVAFVGNLVPAKNVFTLPGIFQRIKEQNEDVAFWIVGQGMYMSALQQRMNEVGVECRFWGNQQPEVMPSIMNCIDVLVLPSKNESFGMVLVEAIACGANAVGSKKGGIPEVIGEENCFELDDCFEEKISERICHMLYHVVRQHVEPEFDWHITARNECRLYSEIVYSSDEQKMK